MCERSMGQDALDDMLVASAGMEDIWVTKEGEHIKYRDLRDSHLANIIRMLNRNLSAMYSGIGPRGDAAQDAWRYEVSTLEGVIEDLELEQERRGTSEVRV